MACLRLDNANSLDLPNNCFTLDYAYGYDVYAAEPWPARSLGLVAIIAALVVVLLLGRRQRVPYTSISGSWRLER